MRQAALACLSLCLIWGTSVTSATADNQSAVSSVQTYDIASQPLDLALARFARISHVDIIYKASPAGRQLSPSVSGAFTPSEVLNRLLDGSGLSWRYTRPDAVVIYDPARPPAEDVPKPAPITNEPTLLLDVMEVRAAPLIGDRRGEFNLYAQTAMSRLTRLLAPRAEAQAQAYHATLRLWIAADGTVSRAALSGEGNAAIIRDIESAVTGVRLDAPPAGMPQPIRFTVEARR